MWEGPHTAGKGPILLMTGTLTTFGHVDDVSPSHWTPRFPRGLLGVSPLPWWAYVVHVTSEKRAVIPGSLILWGRLQGAGHYSSAIFTTV
eukprot:5480260-Pyramimonas_sp.AAC.1